ncbi:chemotaxis protein CheW [Coleofasciculus sp. E1-EBD-02]|uniref:chemotaxis protein CheW n=1 Tax=Coleofasciculus sp. E1-EBD-02 TaxID=3068481 RepID=UPI0032F69C6E
MTTLVTQFQPNDTDLSQSRQVIPSIKFIVFSMGNLHLALRIESVYKVVDHTPIYSSGLNHVGVAHLGDREVTVVDLYWRFFKQSPIQESSTGGYLIVVRNTTGDLYGIPVTDTPMLMEIPLSAIRLLPESYRRADTLEVASHVAVIPQDKEAITVFLLDVDLLMPIFQEIGTLTNKV